MYMIFFLNKKLFVSDFRSDNKETIIASLSQESILKRRRRNTIGIQITVISWMLEFFANIITVSRYFVWKNAETNEWADRWFVLLALIMSYILIPGSYLLNSEAVKLFILAQGWITFIRDNTEGLFQRNRSPDENN